MVFRFLASIFGGAAGEPNKYDDRLIEAAVERLVEGTDPRLRAVRRYQRKLWDATERAVNFVITFVKALPPSIEADRRSYMTNPVLRALFASPEHLQETLSYADGLRDFGLKHPELPGEIFAGLGTIRTEKNVLGMELEGEIIRRDVPQTLVNFHDHRLVCLSGNEQDSRRELMKRGFDYLIETALRRLTSTRLRRSELEQKQRQLLRNKAGLLRKAQVGLESLTAEVSSKPPDYAAIEQKLQDIEAELAQMRLDSDTIDDSLRSLVATIKEPEKYLRLEQVSLRLDSMNILVPPGSTQEADTLTFQEILMGKDRRLVAMFVRFPSQDLLPPRDFLQETDRLFQALQ